ncbi:MAG: S41 family peptidase [Candidatus Yonathbacteria bacterium]|nr:S41 family peptidase [Candidatus Yonathbacteria bacterium]
MNFQNKNINVLLGVILAIIGAFTAGIFVDRTFHPSYGTQQVATVLENGKVPEGVDFAPFWTAWDLLNEKYVKPDKVKNQDKVWGAISGLAQSFGDPYTVFFPPREAEYFQSEVRGNFGGIGVEIGIQDDMLTVIAPLKGTPADHAGMLAGDKIFKINATSTADLKLDEAISLIRGERGTKVLLTVLHEGAKDTVEMSMIRDIINIPTVETKKREDGVFVISLYNFSADSPNLFRTALREFVDSGYNKLVLDLRNNPGGYLEAAIDMASWFLPPGKVVVKEHFGKNKEDEVYRSKGYNIFNDRLKFVILLNKGSASASEILAGALHEHGVAKLVGDKSFGKGSVQELLDVTPDTSLKITVAEWLTPNGEQISGKGLTPDVSVGRTVKDYEKKKDPQMDKAVDILLNGK